MSMAIARRLNKGDSGGGGLGGLIGTALGAVIGSIVPGAGTAAGASLGGAVGGAAGNLIKKPEAPSATPGAMERRTQPTAPISPAGAPAPGAAPDPASHMAQLEDSIKALKEIPEEFQQKYQEPLVRGYAQAFRQNRRGGMV